MLKVMSFLYETNTLSLVNKITQRAKIEEQNIPATAIVVNFQQHFLLEYSLHLEKIKRK